MKPNDNKINKNNLGNKNKINYFNGLKPFKASKTSFKINLNYNNDKLSKPKIIHIFNKNKPINSNDNSKENNNINNINKINIINNNINNNNEFILKEFNNFIKNYEYKSNYKNAELIYNQLYELTLPKDKKLLENIKSLSDENIYKYSSLINYSLKYITNITSFIQKIKYLCNLNSKIFCQQNKNYISYDISYGKLNEEIYKYRDKCKTLLKCEKVNIYFYDINSDCLVLKEENNEKRYPKDKGLIGLSFTSCKKIRHDPNLYNSNLISIVTLEQKLKMKINNLLIFPIKDREKNILGVIGVINKLKEEENNNKSFFDKNDELLLDLLSINVGNFFKYFNIIENQNKDINNYHYILEFWNKLFYKKSLSPSLYLVSEEFTKLMKKVFDISEIQFLLYINQNLFDIHKNKTVELGGLIYKCLIEKKIIFSPDPLINKNYKINIDLPVIYNSKENEILNHEQLITFPVFSDSLGENEKNKKQNIVMIIQIKTKKLIISGDINKENIELNEEYKFILEYSSFLIQKYLTINKEIINKFKYLL